MAVLDHTSDLSIVEMVLNRLPFLADTAKNTTLISNFTLEVMYELEPCLRVDSDLPDGVDTYVGKEANYTIPQRAVIADIVSCYILILKMVANMGGTADNEAGTDGAGANNKILTRTKAGSVEVEWEAFDVKKGGGLMTSGEKLLDLYKKSAIRKAHALGCIIDICDDCTLAVSCLMPEPHPFKVRSSRNCGYGTNIPERG